MFSVATITLVISTTVLHPAVWLCSLTDSQPELAVLLRKFSCPLARREQGMWLKIRPWKLADLLQLSLQRPCSCHATLHWLHVGMDHDQTLRIFQQVCIQLTVEESLLGFQENPVRETLQLIRWISGKPRVYCNTLSLLTCLLSKSLNSSQPVLQLTL